MYPKPDEIIPPLVKAGLLTAVQAKAYVQFVEHSSGWTAGETGIGDIKTEQNDLQEARTKIKAAQKTIAILEAYHIPDVSVECADCGTNLLGQPAIKNAEESEDGESALLCFECAETDEDPSPAARQLSQEEPSAHDTPDR